MCSHISRALRCLTLIIVIPLAAADGQQLDLSGLGGSPESHCNQNHDHNALPWSLPDCNWQAQLEWCDGDNGHNEGAEAALAIACQFGGFPPPLCALAGDVAGELIKRPAVMSVARALARTGNIQAAELAITCQWHNCHALKCLMFHAPEVQDWLATH